MSIFVFRINDGDRFKELKKEIFESGRLRQGWGAPGMDIRNNCDDFISAWNNNWGEGDSDRGRKTRKYNNLKKMLDIKKDDIIIIPKLGEAYDYPCRCFTVVKCVKEYEFSVLEGTNDFGHQIGIETILSCPYGYDNDSIHIKSKFRAYQSAINSVYSASFIKAVNDLITKSSKNSIKSTDEEKDLLVVMAQAVSEGYDAFVENTLEELRKLAPHSFENLIMELFRKNGYVFCKRNDFDKLGGDIDITMVLDDKSLLGTVFRQASNIENIEINIQAKKKEGVNWDDITAVEQLIKRSETKGRTGKNDINIVIDLTDEFREETVRMATDNNIILIDGRQFASLLIQFGIGGEFND